MKCESCNIVIFGENAKYYIPPWLIRGPRISTVWLWVWTLQKWLLSMFFLYYHSIKTLAISTCRKKRNACMNRESSLTIIRAWILIWTVLMGRLWMVMMLTRAACPGLGLSISSRYGRRTRLNSLPLLKLLLYRWEYNPVFLPPSQD